MLDKNTLKKYVDEIYKGKRPPIDVWHYVLGNYRYFLYYSIIWNWLLRDYIREQIDYRIARMNKQCYSTGSCIMCGCETTALQMCNKRCKGICYPTMMSRRQWDKFQKLGTYPERDGVWISERDNRTGTMTHSFYRETLTGYERAETKAAI